MQQFKREMIENMRAIVEKPIRSRKGPTPLQKISKNHPEHEKVVKFFKNKGTLEQNLREAMKLARTFRELNFVLKTEFQPFDPPKFQKNAHGEILHESQPFKHSVFVKLKTGKFVLSNAIMKTVSEVCFRCFFRKCSPLNPKCPYYGNSNTDPLELCSKCDRGFHISQNCVFAKKNLTF